jgi:hypothetical protein
MGKEKLINTCLFSAVLLHQAYAISAHFASLSRCTIQCVVYESFRMRRGPSVYLLKFPLSQDTKQDLQNPRYIGTLPSSSQQYPYFRIQGDKPG